MAFYQSLRNWLGGGAVAQEVGIQRIEPFVKVYESTPNVGIDGAMQVSAVWACVNLLSESISSLPLFVYNVKNGERELDRGSFLYALLHDKPNRHMTSMEFWAFMSLNYWLRGNCYAKLERSANGQVSSMYPLSADQVEVDFLQDGSLIYKYYFNGQVTIYSQESILHIKGTGNGIVGMSRLEYMRNSLGLAINENNLASRTFARDAKRTGTFSIDKTLTPTQRDAIRENFRGLQEGNQTELFVLEAGAKFEPMQMTPADVQLMESRRFSIEEIARWFGVPSVMINDTLQSTTWGSGIEQIIEGFYKFTLRPTLELFEQAITQRVLTPAQRQNKTVEFSLDALLRSNLKDRMEIYAKGVQNGIYTRAEVRQLENMPKIAGTDTLTAQVNLAPLDMLGQTKGVSNASTQDAIAQ